MIRSAKMNASTPPKLIPPFHRTAASGTLPIEQTNEMIATSGPIKGSPDGGERAVALEEQSLPEGVGHPGGERACDQEAAEDVHPDGSAVHHEVVADRGQPLRGAHRRSVAHRDGCPCRAYCSWPGTPPSPRRSDCEARRCRDDRGRPRGRSCGTPRPALRGRAWRRPSPCPMTRARAAPGSRAPACCCSNGQNRREVDTVRTLNADSWTIGGRVGRSGVTVVV
jgi:hypothetical protein